MENFVIWKILGILALILLIVFWKKKSAVWGGFTIGIILGLIVALVFVFIGRGFDWYIIGKGAVSGTLLGFIADMFGKISDLMRGKHGR